MGRLLLIFARDMHSDVGRQLCGRLRQDWAHEGAFVAKHAAALVPDAVSFDEVRVYAKQRTVLLVGGEAGKAEQREGFAARSFRRQEVAMMGAAMQIDQLDPSAGEAFKRVDLRRIDHVLDDASRPNRCQRLHENELIVD